MADFNLILFLLTQNQRLQAQIKIIERRCAETLIDDVAHLDTIIIDDDLYDPTRLEVHVGLGVNVENPDDAGELTTRYVDRVSIEDFLQTIEDYGYKNYNDDHDFWYKYRPKEDCDAEYIRLRNLID